MRRAWKWMKLALAASALGCGGGSPPPSTVGLHQACAPGSQCAQGQRCLQYTGFSGQPISTCEIPCAEQSDCPGSLTCVTVSDGPSQPVCN